MGGMWYRARADLRARWRVLVLLGVLGGILAGAGMASAAGARRTWSAYPRFLERHQVFHTTVSFGQHPEGDRYLDEVAALPSIEIATRGSFFFAGVDTGAREVSFPDVMVFGMDDDRMLRAMRYLSGRIPDVTSDEEIVVGYAFAERFALQVGDAVELVLAGSRGDAPPIRHPARIAGIIVMPGAFETLTGRGFPSVVAATPAFSVRYAHLSWPNDDLLSVRLRGGEEALPAFGDELVARGFPIDGPPQPYSVFTPGVQALNRIPVVALWAAAGLFGLATIAILGQAIARETARDAGDTLALRALGLGGRSLAGVVLVRASVVGGVAALVGCAIAVALSPTMPVGIARIAEPDLGVSVDGVVLLAGAALALLGTLVAAALPAGRAGGLAEVSAGRPSRMAEALAHAGVRAPLVSGVRLALSPGRSGVPVRQAMIGSAIAIGAVVATLVFSASFDRVLSTPRLTGHTWDAAVLTEAPEEQVRAALPLDVVAETWSGSVFPLVDVDGLILTAHASTGPPPSILRGRQPKTADEVALDPVTLRQLGKGIGDVVVARDTPEIGGDEPDSYDEHSLRIVGSYIVPRIPFEPAENAGQGALLSPDGLTRVTRAPLDSVFVRLADGTDPFAGVARVREATADLAFAVVSPVQRTSVRNLERIASVPAFLALIFALVGAAAVAHALITTIRRRRRDVAILATLGFVGSQVRATVFAQAATFVVVASVVGVPAGLIGGRWGWRAFAEAIVIVPEPVAGAATWALVPVALALVLAVAVIPARTAARTRPAVVLRAE